jgi:proline dehydrogenase
MLLRSALLYLARLQWLRSAMASFPVSRRMVRRFVAGERLADALAVCRRLRDENILATLDHLGENVANLEDARVSVQNYLEAWNALRTENLNATTSLKLTQVGLDLSKEACLGYVAELAALAACSQSSIEIDMESSRYTGRTLEIVEEVHRRSGNVRAVIQAYLYRSAEDVARLNSLGIPVRLCKGAYLEAEDVAFPSKTEVDANYLELMEALLQKGNCPALATHDERIIRHAERRIRELELPPDRYEFQMLYGVRRKLQRRLVRAGHRVRLYVPYGKEWYPYFMRRLAERPANLLFVLRNLVQN